MKWLTWIEADVIKCMSACITVETWSFQVTDSLLFSTSQDSKLLTDIMLKYCAVIYAHGWRTRKKEDVHETHSDTAIQLITTVNELMVEVVPTSNMF